MCFWDILKLFNNFHCSLAPSGNQPSPTSWAESSKFSPEIYPIPQGSHPLLYRWCMGSGWEAKAAEKDFQEDGRPEGSLPFWAEERWETRVSSPIDRAAVRSIQKHLLEVERINKWPRLDSSNSYMWGEPQKVMHGKQGVENRFLKLHVQNQVFYNQVKAWFCDLEGGR